MRQTDAPTRARKSANRVDDAGCDVKPPVAQLRRGNRPDKFPSGPPEALNDGGGHEFGCELCARTPNVEVLDPHRKGIPFQLQAGFPIGWDLRRGVTERLGPTVS